MNPTISDFNTSRKILGSLANDEMKKIISEFHDGNIPDIAPTEFSFTMSNTTLQLANAFRREMFCIWGWTLKVISFDPETSENMISIIFIRNEIEKVKIPITDTKILENLEFKIDKQNNTPKSMYVRLEDMIEVSNVLPNGLILFDPKIVVSMLKPGEIIRMRIGCEYGDPKQNIKFSQVSRVVFKYTDIKLLPENETHPRDSKSEHMSGYVIPSVQANPKSFKFNGIILVTKHENVLYNILNETCDSLIDKFKVVDELVKQYKKNKTEIFRNMFLNIIQLETDLQEATLQIPNECHSLGGLFCRYVSDIEPDISFVSYRLFTHENKLEIKIKHTSDISILFVNVISKIISDLENIKKEIILNSD